jgi:hypothetical protein
MPLAHRRWWKTLAAAALVLALGIVSSRVSAPACQQHTKAWATATTRDMMLRLSVSSSSWLRGRTMRWIDEPSLVDQSGQFGSLLGPPLLIPHEGAGEPPWAYAVQLKPETPFVVRIAHGFDVNGQAGGTGIDYYVTAFGLTWLAYRRPVSYF